MGISPLPWRRTGRRLAKLIFILLAETIPSREEVPTALLVHLPDIGFLQRESEEEVG